MRGRVVPVALIALVSSFLWPGSADAAATRCDGRRATIVGTAGSEVINGTAGDDVIVGRAGSDTISGRGGNDRICGGKGNDRLLGGGGNDRLFGGKDRVFENEEGTTSRIGDVLRGGRGNDRLDPGRDTRPAEDITFDAILWDNSPQRMVIDIGTGVATGDGRDSFVARATSVVGSRFADVIDGGPRTDRIFGGPGSDVLRGHRGNDRIFADDGGPTGGDDKLWGGSGDDQLSSEAGQDELRGGPGDDVLDDFADTADLLFGGRGNDLLLSQLSDNGKPQGFWGGAGVDELDLFTAHVNPTTAPSTGTWDMRTGRLVFTLDAPLAMTAAGFQNLDLFTWGTAWTISGTDGPNEVSASGSEGTSFQGLAGNDSFLGSGSDDLFAGGHGVDHSLGMGSGHDTCTSVEVFDSPDCETVTP